MRDGKPYWTKPRADLGDPTYVEHFPLCEINTEATGKWEMFCVDYKPDSTHEGGKWTEFYWNGDLQESFQFTPSTKDGFKEQLEQFIDYWMDENRG